MSKGPKLNNISKSFTTRDSLGIEGVEASIQADICPIVNTVTPRAFYWPFLAWIYYDFYKYSGIPEHTYSSFDAYLKRQDYFFVLATLLTKDSDQTNLVGKQKTQENIEKDPDGPYFFDPTYFKTAYGGMQYYNSGCLSMLFITDENPEDEKKYSFPVLRPEGEKMAKAFESVVKNTEYYKSYRRNDEAVPKTVLEEYGKVINIGLRGFDECKAILKHYLFEDDRAVQLKHRSQLLTENAKYLELIMKENKVADLSLSTCRQLLYDHVFPTGEEMVITEECRSVANKWEIAIGRMYFTSGLEMIWKYMLEQLIEPFTLREWINAVIKASDFKWDLDALLLYVIGECSFDFENREGMISETARKDTSSYSIENGVKIILSVYNHFNNRSDFGNEKSFFDYGIDNQSISLSEMFGLVDDYKDKSIRDFIVFVMQNWLIEQHYLTAFDKLLQGRDGFYYEVIDKRYIRKHEFDMEFQGIRLRQLATVMRDLDML